MPDYLVTLPTGERYKLSMPEEAEGARETAAQRLRAGAVGPGDRPTPEVPQDFQTWGNLAEARSKNFPHFPDDVRQVPDYIQAHPESITDMLGMGGTLKLVQSGPTKLIKIFGEHGVTKHQFDIVDEATGQKVGHTKVTYNPQKKNITVDYIESAKPHQPEQIKSAAVVVDGKVYTAPVHAEAFDKAFKASGESNYDSFVDKHWTPGAGDGFVTTQGRYVERPEAYEIAKSGGALEWESSKPWVDAMQIRGMEKGPTHDQKWASQLWKGDADTTVRYIKDHYTGDSVDRIVDMIKSGWRPETSEGVPIERMKGRVGSMGYAINPEANTLGSREIRTLLPAAKQAFPNAESVSGFRVTGARQATGELGGMTLPLPGSKVKPQAEARPQIDPEIAGSYLDQWSRAAPAEPAPRYTNEDIDRLSGYLDSLSGPRSLR